MGRMTTLLLLALLLPAAAAAQSPLQDRFFDSDGVRIRYVDAGAGEPVLLIHGFSANLDVNWVGTGIVAALLDTGYRVVAYDDRGQGASDKPHDPAAYGVPEIEDIVRLLDRLGIASAHVVGYSRGGVLGMELWAMHPERVRTLVLGDSPGAERRISPPGLTQEEVADSVAAGNPGPLMHRLSQPGYRPPPAADTVAAIFQKIWRANDFAALAAILRASLPPVAAHRLETNTTPAIAIVGEHDGIKPEVDSLVARMSGIEEVVIPGATHLTAARDPAFARALLGFLAAHADTAVSKP